MIDTDKLFAKMQRVPVERIDKVDAKVRRGCKYEPEQNALTDAKAAERVVLAQVDIIAAKWNSQLAIGYWELQRLFAKTRSAKR